MGLPIRIETRTGDTPASKRQRQRRDPPDILLTTPEQLALLLASRRRALSVRHAQARGARRTACAGDVQARRPAVARAGAAVHARAASSPRSACRRRSPSRTSCAAFWCRSRQHGRAHGRSGDRRRPARSRSSPCSTRDEHLPWAGHSARHALGEIYAADQDAQDHAGLRQHAQPGGIAVPGTVADQRRQPRHRAASRLARCRAAPPGRGGDGRRQAARGGVHLVARSRHRLGRCRSRHQCRRAEGLPRGCCSASAAPITGWTSPRKAVLVPANRFEVLECRAAIDAVAENAQDTPPLRTGALDVLAQHVLGRACGEPFLADELYAEVRAAAPYAALTRADFDAAVDFVATGGYALKAYERFAKIRQGKDGRWRITHPRVAQRYRLNVGTIVEADMIKVRLVRSRGSRRRSSARRPAARRSRGIFHRDAGAGRHLRVRRRGAEIRGAGRGRGLRLARRRRAIRRCRPTRAASFRSRPISPRGCARCSPIARGLARAAAAGARMAGDPGNGARCCRRRATCWSRPFRAAPNIISSAIRSRAGSRTRRSACC